MKVLTAFLLLFAASPAQADEYLDFTDLDHACKSVSTLNFGDNEPSKQQADPPLPVDQTIDKNNPFANVDPAFDWPDYSGSDGGA